MDYRTAFEISANGMSVERLRMDVTALNLANMHVTANNAAGLYRPLRVVMQPQVQDFQQAWTQALPQVTVQPTDAAPHMVREPGHPHADANGMVAYPGIDHTAEMLNLVTALRAYEANVMAANASRTMAARALEIGGQ
jgi:flagellar basal-body rod protein FlgC